MSLSNKDGYSWGLGLLAEQLFAISKTIGGHQSGTSSGSSKVHSCRDLQILDRRSLTQLYPQLQQQ